MESKLWQDLSPIDRLQFLKDNAERAEKFTYPKHLDSDQLSNLKDDLTNDSVALAKLEEKKKEFNLQHKAEVKPIKQRFATILNKLRNKSEEVEEEVFLIADYDDNMMGYYNADGLLVHSRILDLKERQYRVIDMSKNGTNNN